MPVVIQDAWHWLIAHWLLVLPILLGFALVWMLLPGARQRPFWPSLVVGAFVLIAAGTALIEPYGPAAETVLFYIFGGLAVTSGVCMIVQKNPVHAALWFALVILSTCGLFLLQAAPFLAAATIIVYAGAIIVTFLFVIMLAQQTGLATYDRRSREPFLASLAGFVLLGSLLYTLQMTYHPKAPIGDIIWRLDMTQVQLGFAPLGQPFEGDLTIDGRPLGAVLVEEAQRLESWEDKEKTVSEIGTALSVWSAAKRDNQQSSMLEALVSLRGLAQRVRDAEFNHRGVLAVSSGAENRSSLSAPTGSEHAANLGRSLFSDYLWAVEIAGTLLLVATIGAIAISARRAEVVR